MHFREVLWNKLLLKFNKAEYLFNKENIPVLNLAKLGNDARNNWSKH